MNVRKVVLADRDEWARMRVSLWPDSYKKHIEEIEKYFSGDESHIVEVFVLERANSKLGGFIELNVRSYAEGSESANVPYVEGWYIDKDLRRKGHGRQLIEKAESWVLESGFSELASDTELENEMSVAAHKALGFREVEKLVCFIKKLK